MYSKIKKYTEFKDVNIQNVFNFKKINEIVYTNDFEIIAKQENKKIADLLNFLSSLKNSIYSRMTGSGSCCYAVFENKKDANKAYHTIYKEYNNYWVMLAENNITNK